MDQWGVVGVIVALVGLFSAVLVPIVRLNNCITKFTCAVEMLEKNVDKLAESNSDSHTRLWAHNDKQDETINDHEARIQVIEKRGE